MYPASLSRWPIRYDLKSSVCSEKKSSLSVISWPISRPPTVISRNILPSFAITASSPAAKTQILFTIALPIKGYCCSWKVYKPCSARQRRSRTRQRCNEMPCAGVSGITRLNLRYRSPLLPTGWQAKVFDNHTEGMHASAIYEDAYCWS